MDLLRSNSALKAEKKAARVAADGVLKIFVGSEYATLIEINSETDFAAKDTNFINFTNDVSDYIAANKISDVSEFSESEIEEKKKSANTNNWRKHSIKKVQNKRIFFRHERWVLPSF